MLFESVTGFKLLGGVKNNKRGEEGIIAYKCSSFSFIQHTSLKKEKERV